MRIRLFITSIIFLGISTTVFANCDTPESRYEYSGCASEQLEAADKQLNQTYKALLSAQETDAKSKLITAQRAWVAFRDADKYFAYAHSGEGGSLAGLIALNHVLDLTLQREKELKEFLNVISK